ncbi:MAG: hypothetical protein AAGD35_01775 [Actinomycetota bacterium]
MKQITLERLRCVATDDVGRDEIRIEVYGDGELDFAARRVMDDGDDWPVDGATVFDRSCTIRLFEEDLAFPGDNEDALGLIEIEPADVERGTATFAPDGGAHYTLTYSVAERSDLEGTDLADRAAELFERSTLGGLWQAIDKSSLLANVRQRRQRAETIDQETSNFCGPTSIAHELARTQPRRYVELCRQLYETGGFWSRTKRVEADARLRADAVGQGMEPADWMLIATMRNSENTVFKVESDATGLMSGLQGMTFPWEIKGWAKEILMKDDVDIDVCAVFGELDAIKRAQEVYDQGGSVFILLNMAVLKKGEPTIPPFPDHWVVFRGNLDLSDADRRVGFDVYTWGRVMPLDLSRKRFERSIFCTVTAL